MESLGTIDIGILLLYACVLIVMGVYYRRKCRTSAQFMVADRSIPAWAAGLAVMGISMLIGYAIALIDRTESGEQDAMPFIRFGATLGVILFGFVAVFGRVFHHDDTHHEGE